jgi:hypothetical protein
MSSNLIPQFCTPYFFGRQGAPAIHINKSFTAQARRGLRHLHRSAQQVTIKRVAPLKATAHPGKVLLERVVVRGEINCGIGQTTLLANCAEVGKPPQR